MKTTVNVESGKQYNSIVSLHALRTNESEVNVFFENGHKVTYPSGSFKRGNVYDINCVKLTFNEDSMFTATLIEKEKLTALLS